MCNILRSVKITVTVSPEPTQKNTVTRIVSFKIEKASACTPIKSQTARFRGKSGRGDVFNSLQAKNTIAQTNEILWYNNIYQKYFGSVD